MRKIIFVASFLVVILIVSLLVLAYLDRPSFELINHTQKDVREIKVFWRDKAIKLSGIKAGEKEKLYINSESAARFVVTFVDSRIIESGEIYFTSGTRAIVDIYNDDVKLSYNFQRS